LPSVILISEKSGICYWTRSPVVVYTTGDQRPDIIYQ